MKPWQSRFAGRSTECRLKNKGKTKPSAPLVVSEGLQSRAQPTGFSRWYLSSEHLFCELDQTARKPRLAKQIDRAKYELLVSRLQSVAELVDAQSVVDVCRDPKDNSFLVLAKEGNVDYLPCQFFWAGDHGLQVMGTFEKTKIVSLANFEDTCNDI